MDDWARGITMLGRGLSRAVYSTEPFGMAGYGGPGFLSVPIYKYNAASRQLDSTGFIWARKMEGVYISFLITVGSYTMFCFCAQSPA
jgi:hypothetical protein